MIDYQSEAKVIARDIQYTLNIERAIIDLCARVDAEARADEREEAAKVCDAIAVSQEQRAANTSGLHQQQRLDWARGAQQGAIEIRRSKEKG